MDSREKEILEKVKKFGNKLPKFPDGRIDYSNSKEAPVVIIFLKYQDEFLFLKRSDKVSTYQGKWNVVAGFLDEIKPIKEKVLGEIKEELSINEDDILSIHIGKSYEFYDEKINRTWVRQPVVVELNKKPEIKLDWEHTDYRWVKAEELKNLDIIPDTLKTLKCAFN